MKSSFQISDFMILAISIMYVYLKINNVNNQFRENMFDESNRIECTDAILNTTSYNVNNNLNWFIQNCDNDFQAFLNAWTNEVNNHNQTQLQIAREQYNNHIQNCLHSVCIQNAESDLAINSACITTASYLLSGVSFLVTYILL